jgi:hypothetical protein
MRSERREPSELLQLLIERVDYDGVGGDVHLLPRRQRLRAGGSVTQDLREACKLFGRIGSLESPF